MILYTPPVAFIIILAVSIALSQLSSYISYRPKNTAEGFKKAYTGGEEVKTHRVQPDYSQFFPFAFFFTILHVVTLVVATVPKETAGSFTVAVIYILGAVLGLFILFRRDPK